MSFLKSQRADSSMMGWLAGWGEKMYNSDSFRIGHSGTTRLGLFCMREFNENFSLKI